MSLRGGKADEAISYPPSVIARRQSRRSNLEDRRAELTMTLEEIAALHCVPLAMTYEGVIARRRSRRSNLISICHCEEAFSFVIARRRSRRSNLEDRRAELTMTVEEIAALHCVPLAMTYKGVIARRLPLLSLRGGKADEAISEIAVLNSR